MRNTLNLKFFGYEKGTRKQGDHKGEVYYAAKFLDDEALKLVAFLIDDVDLQDSIVKLERYKDYLCEVDFVRNRYGNYEMNLLSIA